MSIRGHYVRYARFDLQSDLKNVCVKLLYSRSDNVFETINRPLAVPVFRQDGHRATLRSRVEMDATLDALPRRRACRGRDAAMRSGHAVLATDAVVLLVHVPALFEVGAPPPPRARSTTVHGAQGGPLAADVGLPDTTEADRAALCHFVERCLDATVWRSCAVCWPASTPPAPASPSRRPCTLPGGIRDLSPGLAARSDDGHASPGDCRHQVVRPCGSRAALAVWATAVDKKLSPRNALLIGANAAAASFDAAARTAVSKCKWPETGQHGAAHELCAQARGRAVRKSTSLSCDAETFGTLAAKSSQATGQSLESE